MTLKRVLFDLSIEGRQLGNAPVGVVAERLPFF
jgi:hypothetical protein